MGDFAVTEPARTPRRATVATFFAGRTLEACVASGRDNILQLRLLAALMVVLGHSCMGGAGSLPYDPLNAVLPRMQIHPAGLMVFFMISGFLITLSYSRRPHLLRFLRARALRLWPALIVCLALWAFVLGPLLTTLPLSDYFSTGRADNPYRYVIDGVSMMKFANELPGLFRSTTSIVPGEVNTPLWSLTVEATMYLWVAGAGLLRLFRLPWLSSLAIAAFFSAALLWPMMQGAAPSYLLTIQGFFGAGAIACLLRRYIPISSGLMLLIAIVCVAARNSSHTIPITWLTIAYFVLWFSYVPRLPPIPGDTDLSYGTYIWAWPIQQTLVLLTHTREPLVLFPMTLVFLLPIAAASWFLVEKPALRIKDWRRAAGAPARAVESAPA